MTSAPNPDIDIKPVIIDRYEIGPSRRVFIVAEIGVNHDGDVDKAIKLVDSAVACGADAVKFQMFSASRLASAEARTVGYQQQACGESSQREMLEKLELSGESFYRIKEHCASRGVLFFATPFSTEDVTSLVELGGCAIKIASTDLDNEPLLRAAVSTALPMIVSTGASKEEEIRRTAESLIKWGQTGRCVFLHCVSSYPTPLDSVNLRAIGTLQKATGLPCGLSDHTTSARTGALAVAAGACLLEKHFTLDRGDKGPDHLTSLEPDEFSHYVSLVREAERMLGSGTLGLSEIEYPVRELARKSVVAAVHIPAGAKITASMLAIKRPGTGFSPMELDQLIGQKASTDIPEDTVIAGDMFG